MNTQKPDIEKDKNDSAMVPSPASGTAADKPEVVEKHGPKGLEPTRYGDWEIGGKCVDF